MKLNKNTIWASVFFAVLYPLAHRLIWWHEPVSITKYVVMIPAAGIIYYILAATIMTIKKRRERWKGRSSDS